MGRSHISSTEILTFLQNLQKMFAHKYRTAFHKTQWKMHRNTATIKCTTKYISWNSDDVDFLTQFTKYKTGSVNVLIELHERFHEIGIAKTSMHRFSIIAIECCSQKRAIFKLTSLHIMQNVKTAYPS